MCVVLPIVYLTKRTRFQYFTHLNLLKRIIFNGRVFALRGHHSYCLRASHVSACPRAVLALVHIPVCFLPPSTQHLRAFAKILIALLWLLAPRSHSKPCCLGFLDVPARCCHA